LKFPAGLPTLSAFRSIASILNSDAPINDLQALVQTAIGTEETSVTGMLKCIAELFDAQGCGLWEIPKSSLVSGFNPDPLPAPKWLLTVAAWWEGERLFAMDDVPLSGSPTARVAQTQLPEIVLNIRDKEQGGPKAGHSFWEETDMEGMCAVPVKFIDGNLGAINVYRQKGKPSFTKQEMRRLEVIATIIPGLYRAIREKIELRLVKEIENLLRDNDEAQFRFNRRAGKNLKKKTVTEILEKVCIQVSTAFDCIETSIFLEHGEVFGSYRLAATTNLECVPRKTYYLPQDHARLTGHVLITGDSLAISDLAKLNSENQFNSDEDDFKLRRGERRDTANAKRLLGLSATSSLPPLSFMAVPIFGDTDWYFNTDLCGAIRCHMAKSGPFYFGQRELDLLEVVARQIGKWWAAWRTRTELEAENAAWKLLGQKFDTLNTFALQELNKETPKF
jgi:hypothetical protein